MRPTIKVSHNYYKVHSHHIQLGNVETCLKPSGSRADKIELVCEVDWPLPAGTSCLTRCKEGFLFKPSATEELFEFGPTIQCKCRKSESSCRLNRIRGRCTEDPSYGPTTVAPEKCWYIKPAFPEEYELAGPCVFPLNHQQQCRIKCGDKGFGFAECRCRDMVKALEIGGINIGSISGGGGGAASVSIGGGSDPEPTSVTMTTIDPHDSTQFDGIASCDFILPKMCQTGDYQDTLKPTDQSSISTSGCKGVTVSGDISVNCGGLTQHVGPNSKCKAICVDDPLEEEHEAFCRCDLHTGCHWELKQAERCAQLGLWISFFLNKTYF